MTKRLSRKTLRHYYDRGREKDIHLRCPAAKAKAARGKASADRERGKKKDKRRKRQDKRRGW